MTIKNTNHIYKDELKKSELFAIWITERIGTIGFFFIIIIWTVIWLCWNMFAPLHLCFDPFPGFVLWLFISNLIQIMLMPLIMVGQNLQAKRAEIRSENDFNVNIKAEKEITFLIEEMKELKVMVSKLTKDHQ
ncbi:DUF1003 domain-containing protein [Bizionia arctica]|uniref:DUF1003 domain-containing protein n=1 Tax=Bizionia arctica TaxID=1495645 RepID=A0A917GK88_9FLAO|nr:DUF1003 domain-containing protein [Bizionia arctica]GGG49412.1 hypothetical protein GCM10010976_20920 [Bizionia arctica]